MARQTESRNFGLGDSYINLIVGIIVVVAVGALIIGLIRGRSLPGPTPKQEEAQTQPSQAQITLPAKHTVAEGEDLWKISEKYYKTGYNWVDIAEENKLANPNAIAAGMELTIPNVAPRATQAPTQLVEATVTPVPTVPDAKEPTVTTGEKGDEPTILDGAITGNTYTVVRGDYLWAIAIRAYGDGYKWIDIARANKLDNPDVIHTGNVLTLPR